MGALVLPVIAVTILVTIICAWVALARYDRAHPPAADQDDVRRPGGFRRDGRS